MTRRHETGIGAQLRALKEGQSITFVRETKRLPVKTQLPSQLSRMVGGYGLRLRPGCRWSYETFTTTTSRGRLIVGCTMTLEQAEQTVAEADPVESLWHVDGQWYVAKGPALKRAEALERTAIPVDVPITAASLAAFLTKLEKDARAAAVSETRVLTMREAHAECPNLCGPHCGWCQNNGVPYS